MKKIFNRIKFWILARRYHIHGIRLESNKSGGVDVLVQAKGKTVRVAIVSHLTGVSEGVTDYGIMLRIKEATHE